MKLSGFRNTPGSDTTLTLNNAGVFLRFKGLAFACLSPPEHPVHAMVKGLA